MAVRHAMHHYETPPGRGDPRIFFLEVGYSPHNDSTTLRWDAVGIRGGLQLSQRWVYETNGIDQLVGYIERMIGDTVRHVARFARNPRPIVEAMMPQLEREVHFEMERLEHEVRHVMFDRIDPRTVYFDPAWDGRMGGTFSSEPSAAEKQAKKKATELLLKNLDERQRQDFKLHKQFTMTGKDGKAYIITSARSFNVQGPDGRKYCGQLVNTPIEDQMLAQKLLLEHDPDKFFKNANVSGGRL